MASLSRVLVAGCLLALTLSGCDIFDKKNGELEFVIRDTAVTDSAARKVADLRSVLIRRHAAQR